VDDEPGFTRLLKLTRAYDVKEENDARRAVETAKQFKPDLNLLDVIMPLMDGGDLPQYSSRMSLKHIPTFF